MSNITKQITMLPSDIMGIRLEWLEDKKATCTDSLKTEPRADLRLYYSYTLDFIHELENNLFPVEPLLEGAFSEGSDSMMINYNTMHGIDTKQIESDKQTYLSQPITIKIEENE